MTTSSHTGALGVFVLGLLLTNEMVKQNKLCDYVSVLPTEDSRTSMCLVINSSDLLTSEGTGIIFSLCFHVHQIIQWDYMLCIEASAFVIHLYLFIEFSLHYSTSLYIVLILNETLSSYPSKCSVPVLFSFPQCDTVLETLRACSEFKMKSCRFDIV